MVSAQEDIVCCAYRWKQLSRDGAPYGWYGDGMRICGISGIQSCLSGLEIFVEKTYGLMCRDKEGRLLQEHLLWGSD